MAFSPHRAEPLYHSVPLHHQLKDAIADFRAGNILVSVCGLPFKGPCAPYVYALLLRSLIKRKNMDKVLGILCVSIVPC